MDRLRLPGSWRARLDFFGAAGAAAAAAGVFGLNMVLRERGATAFLPLYWLWLALGAAGVGVRLLSFLLERRGGLEFVGEAEERVLRTRRLLTVRGELEPVRGRGLPEAADDTPAHVKAFSALALLAWCVALPTGNRAELPVETRFWFLWAAVVPSAAAVFCFLWHESRTALRLVREASED